MKLKSEWVYLEYMVYLCSYVKQAGVLLVMDFLGSLNPKSNPWILQTRTKSVKGRWQYKIKVKKEKRQLKNFVVEYIFCWYNLYRYWKKRKKRKKKEAKTRGNHMDTYFALIIDHSSIFFFFFFIFVRLHMLDKFCPTVLRC
jgi:hypothetical protein